MAHLTTSSETEVLAELITFTAGKEQAMLPEEWEDMCMCEHVFVWLHHLGRAGPDTLPLGFFLCANPHQRCNWRSLISLPEVLHLPAVWHAGDASCCGNPALLNSCSAIPRMMPFASVGRGEVALPPHCLFLLY